MNSIWIFLQYKYTNMPRQILKPPKLKSSKNNKLKSIEMIHERTRKAIKFYTNNKKIDLQQAKQRYLQKIGVQNIRSKSIQQMTQKSNDQMRSERFLRQPSSARKSIYKQQSSLESHEEIIQMSLPPQESENYSIEEEQSSLSQVNKYGLKQIHYTILEVQKIIDNFLDFHYTNRNKRSLSKQQLLNFLKTTKYSLNCQKYVDFLNAYNRKLYKWSEGRIYCKAISGKECQERLAQTKQRMGRRKIKELDIIFN